MSDRYNVINQEEPRRQSVAVNGIPCTARHCVTQLNRLTQENEKLKEENANKEDNKIKYVTEYTVIDREKPCMESVAVNGIPCTPSYCAEILNRLTKENEELKEENMNKELSKKETHIGKLVVYGQLQLLAELKEENTGDNK